MTEALVRGYGPTVGAELLGQRLDLVYGALIHEVHRYGGVVIGFGGDAITCWFEEDDGTRALSAALGMQAALATRGPPPSVAEVPLADGGLMRLGLKVAVARGQARRFLVGDPSLQVVEVLAGRLLVALAGLEQLAQPGMVLAAGALAGLPGLRGRPLAADPAAASGLAGSATVVEALAPLAAPRPWPPTTTLGEGAAAWLLPAVRQRMGAGGAALLAGFRPAAALFLAWEGIDYDGDDEAPALLDAFVRRAQRVLADHDGALVQLTIGDKGSYLYGAFGAPLATGVEAEQAVAAARALLRTAPPPLRGLRAGVAHGPMFAGAYGAAVRKTFGVLGTKTNLAARLMAAAPAGAVWCDAETVRRSHGRFGFEQVGALSLKGVEGAVEVFAPQVELRDPRTATAAPSGRAGELRQLLERVLPALHGRPLLTVLEGPAGMGKTALLLALAARAEAEGLWVLQGGSGRHGRNHPFSAYRPVLERLLGLDGREAEAEDPAGHGRRAATAVAELLGAEDPRLPLLAELLDLELPQPQAVQPGEAAPEPSAAARLAPELRSQNLRQLLAELLLAAAARRPLLLLLDEGQSMDTLSWELAAELGQLFRRRAAPVAVVLATRPLYGGPVGSAPLRAILGTADALRMELPPLAPEAVQEQLGALLGLPAERLPAEWAASLHRRAGGNPLFVAELLRAALEAGSARLVGGEQGQRLRLRPQAAEGEQGTPTSLHGLVLARVERLQPESQLCLKAAAVAGEEVEAGALAAALATVAPELLPRLERLLLDLQARGLLLPSAAGGRHGFVSEVVRRGVYDSLLFAQRRLLHRAMATWCQTRLPAGAERDARFAHHAVRAMAPDDPPPTIALTLATAEAVGRRWAALGDHAAAAELFRMATAGLPDEPAWAAARVALLLALGESQLSLGAFEEANRSFEEAGARAFRADDGASEAASWSGLCRVALATGDPEAAAVLARQGLEQAEAAGAVAEVGKARLNLAAAADDAGDLAGAAEHLEAALAIHRAMQDRQGVATACERLASVAVRRGGLALAGELLDEAAAARSGDALAEARLLVERAGLLQLQGRQGQAMEALRDGQRRLARLGARLELASANLRLAGLLQQAGAQAEAREARQDALAAAMEMGAVPLALEALCALATAELEAAGLEVAGLEAAGSATAGPARARRRVATTTLAQACAHPACPAALRRRVQAQRAAAAGEPWPEEPPTAATPADLAAMVRAYQAEVAAPQA